MKGTRYATNKVKGLLFPLCAVGCGDTCMSCGEGITNSVLGLQEESGCYSVVTF